ncbi:MAG TPA: DUF3866 family protein [Bacilli bacterium]
MIGWAKAEVLSCRKVHQGLQEITVRFAGGDVGLALHYADQHLPELRQGSMVLLNTTAVSLKLGTGGYHFVAAVLDGSGVAKSPPAIERQSGHMMKLRYTPLQRAVQAAEETVSPFHGLFSRDARLDGMPVLLGELHSMLPICACWIKHAAQSCASKSAPGGGAAVKPLKVAYVMTDGGALPLAFSKHVAVLREREYIAATVTYGHAYGGDLETINKFTGLLAAKHAARCDIAIVAMGPGIAGTGTAFGHSGVEVGELVNAVSLLGGVPIVIPRISFAETRKRHLGLSHHFLNTLGAIALRSAVIPLPAAMAEEKKRIVSEQLRAAGLDEKHQPVWMGRPGRAELALALADYPLRVTTMGKDLVHDPDFFLGVGAAAEYARGLCGGLADGRRPQ